MKIGYVRTSKKEQNPEMQRRELEAAGCERLFEESISSRKEDRPQLRAALDYCREGDALVVWKLDRLGRSLRELTDKATFLGQNAVKNETGLLTKLENASAKLVEGKNADAIQKITNFRDTVAALNSQGKINPDDASTLINGANDAIACIGTPETQTPTAA
jgi:Resolvase, N terminal domain